MKKIVLTLLLAGLACASPVLAADHAVAAKAPKAATPAQAAQQNRMKMCAKQYHEKNVAKSQYRAFMSQCLRKNKTATTPAPVQAAPAKAVAPAVIMEALPAITTKAR